MSARDPWPWTRGEDLRALSLRQLRRARFLTQGQLAERAGVALRTVWAVERTGVCRQEIKRRLLRALSIPFERAAECSFGPRRARRRSAPGRQRRSPSTSPAAAAGLPPFQAG